MSVFLPDSEILCEECDTYFFKYAFVQNEFDADADPSCMSGLINRITCPSCKTEFTFETPILMYSHTNRFLLCSSFKNEQILNITSLKRALEITKCDKWRLRRCTYAMDAAEKARIFVLSLDDGKIELLKLKFFDDYKDMDLSDNYITFENITDDRLVFTYRDYKDNILETRYIPKDAYNSMPETSLAPYEWHKIDRSWAIKTMEDTK